MDPLKKVGEMIKAHNAQVYDLQNQSEFVKRSNERSKHHTKIVRRIWGVVLLMLLYALFAAAFMEDRIPNDSPFWDAPYDESVCLTVRC